MPKTGPLVLRTCVAGAIFLSAQRAQAEAPRGEVGLLPPRTGYRLSLEIRENFATRTDFSRPLFLFQQPVDHVSARELSFEAELWLALTPRLALGVRLPYSVRDAGVRFAPVEVSHDARLPPEWRELEGHGLTDPTLSALYRVVDGDHLTLAATLGVVLPHDDNPGSSTVPVRLPPSTGQGEGFAEGTAVARFSGGAVALSYRAGYRPGGATTYLVRRVGPGAFASGALGRHTRQRARLDLRFYSDRTFWLRFIPEWRLEGIPPIVDHGKEYAFQRERFEHELGLDVRFGARLSRKLGVELSYALSLLESWQRDPFFPIAIPRRGFGIAWWYSGS
ncbi:MAG: hypothetical protein DIU78_006660 [Pseudomonadota bacterium]